MPQLPPVNFASSGYEAITRPNRQNRQPAETSQPPVPESNRENLRDVRLISAVNSSQNLAAIENSRLVRTEQQGPGQSSSNQSPVNQYQANQDILRREEIGQLVGIDIFV